MLVSPPACPFLHVETNSQVKEYITSKLQQDAFHIKPMMGTYVWLTPEYYKIQPPPSINFFTFEAKATLDIHIGFNSNTSSSEGRDLVEKRVNPPPFYEVVIGGWLNTKTIIRKKGEAVVSARKENNPQSVILNLAAWEPYWCLLDTRRPDHRILSIGHGSFFSTESTMIQLIDNENDTIPNLSFIGLSSWSGPIDFRGWKFYDHIQYNSKFSSQITNTTPNNDPSHTFKLRLRDFYNKDKFSDLKLIFKDSNQSLLLHKIVLYSCCPSFFSLLHTTDQLHYSFIDSNHDDYQIWETILQPFYSFTPNHSSLSSSQTSLFNEILSFLSSHSNFDPSPFYQNTMFSDIVVQTSDKSFIPCHKLVLCIQSDYFYTMFHSSMMESSTSTLVLSSSPASTSDPYLHLLYFLYHSSLVSFPNLLSTFKNCQNLLASLLLESDRIGLVSIYSFLIETISNHEEILNEKNIIPLLEVSKLLHVEEIVVVLQQWLIKNFEYFGKQEEFGELLIEDLIDCLISKELVTPSGEEEVFESLLRWIDYNDQVEKECIQEMMKLVRYYIMSDQYLIHVVLDNTFVQSSSSLLSIVQNALTCVQNKNNNTNNNNNNNNSPKNERIGSPGTNRENNNNNSNNSHFQITDNQISLLPLDSIHHPLRKHHRSSISLSNRTPLLFSSPGDDHGLFSFLSKHSLLSSTIKITSSSPVSRYTNPNVLLHKNYVTTNYTTGRPPWWKVEIVGEGRDLVCNYWAIRQDGSDSFLRNWKLEGSVDGKEWSVLEEYENDWSIGAPGQWRAWSVRSGRAWKWFRVVMTGPTSNEYDRNKMSMCGLELYGYFKE
eukprot:TRINITY_DN4028_c1_g1_i1.p1 TRINITY_DN4028_c1_g1~~TRINITY_DN4028_c1_g1_i1.p1  ORF type:complete len:828 (+),score=171.30 TRINITY_DN4028_c1_g1_i1:71-2554(+)